jgi:hypothetical protein
LTYTRINQTWPMALLCLLASTLWIFLDRFPQITFTPASDALACVLITLIAAAIARTHLRPTLTDALAGAFLLAGPASSTILHASIDPGTLAIALTLTPVVVAVAESTTTELSADTLWPGLLAATGLLLVLPAPSLTGWRTDLALLLTPVLTGIGCVLFRRSPTAPSSKIAAAAAAATFFFLLTAWLETKTTQTVSLSATAVDATLFTLTLLTLTRLSPTQYTARYAIVPLAVLVEGPLLLHSTITWRAVLCAALLLIAAITLLRSPDVHTEALEDHSP